MKKRKQPERLSDIPLAPCTIGGRTTGPAYTTLGEKTGMTEEQLESLDQRIPLRDCLFIGEGQQPITTSPQETSRLVNTMAQDIGLIATDKTFDW